MTRATLGKLLALGAAATVMLAGCASESSGGSPSDDWSIPDEDPTATINVVGIVDPVAENMDEVVAAFEEAHPTIDVNYQFVPFDDLNSVLDTRITSKSGDPDVFWVDQPRVPALSARGYLEDLTEAFEGRLDGLVPATVESSSYDGKLWSVPIANSTQVLFYNKDILDAAGITPPGSAGERVTWQQLKELAAQAQQSGGADHGLMVGQPNRYYQLEPLPVSAGGGVGVTGDDMLTPDFTNDGWVEAMTYYGSLFADGVSPKGITPEQTDATFLAGKTAFFVEGNWMVPKMLDATFNWGAALNPVWEGGDPATPTGSWSLGINPFSKNKEAAAIFIDWMAIDGEGGYGEHRAFAELPANTKGLETYLAGPAFTSSEGGAQAAEVIAEETESSAVARASTVGYIEFEEILGRAFSDIANGADPAEALAAAEAELTNAWKQYQ
ncbi:sugar ABC transporter substrate-binding protein [Microbacterium sp. CFH 90308]|uniref:Sugar ABC transporter substrate-binding protein n=1 Tax=Microbacterium salsuginis TaxID=2722803 RepID=A0ABX1K945_9MICO|nr:sugar ABC transporter substrate-binding protein [Microbacterium sp. CFH 90308]NLP83519.1 sugar ABC transporter substrate-binding protein [Microbacterium sp. CFH 90308]